MRKRIMLRSTVLLLLAVGFLPLAVQAQRQIPQRVAVTSDTRETVEIIPDSTLLDRETVFKPLPKPNPKFEVTKVHTFDNTPEFNPANNRALAFERQYWDYGAILAVDRYNRAGQYFVITWINKDAPGDYRALFQYRQQRTRDHVRELVIDHAGSTKGAHRSIFGVLGQAYTEYGPITSWRFTVWRGDELVAEEQSFVW